MWERPLDRVNEISAFQLGRVNLSRVPVNRLSTLARYELASKAASIGRAPDPKRTALMAAVVRSLEAVWLGRAVVPFLCSVVLVFTGARSRSYLAMSGRLVHRSRGRRRVCREITLAPSLNSSASPVRASRTRDETRSHGLRITSQRNSETGP